MTNLLNQANQYYENDQYTQAKDLYRRAFLENPPTSMELNFLDTSEQYEKLLYLKQLRELYPNVKTLIEEEASYLARLGAKSQALALFEKLLDDENLKAEDRRRIHNRRFHTNIRFGKPDFDSLFEDFSFLYNVEASFLTPKFITRVMNDISSIEALPFLKKLQSQFIEAESDLYRLIDLKISYLEYSDRILNKGK